MNRSDHQPDDSWENDPVWKLLDQAPPAAASTRFVDDTVRAARLLGQPQPWWKRLFAPIPIAALAGASAALFFSVHSIIGTNDLPATQSVSIDIQNSPAAEEIQDFAETQTLIAATEHLDQFSDQELVSLIGF